MVESNSATPVARRSSDTMKASDERPEAAIDIPEKDEKSNVVAADEKSDGTPDDKNDKAEEEKEGGLKDYLVSYRLEMRS